MSTPIPVRLIMIRQVEGTHPLVSADVITFAEANARIRDIAMRHDGVGYLKTDVTVIWQDNTALVLRADVHRYSISGVPTVGILARDWARDAEPTAYRSTKAKRILSGELMTHDASEKPEEPPAVLVKTWKAEASAAGVILTLNGQRFELGGSKDAIAFDLQRAAQGYAGTYEGDSESEGVSG